MVRFILKPIFWNTNNYKRPSGVISTSGFPQKTGYGHEEWNNHSEMKIQIGNTDYRVFHTEGLGESLPDENDTLFVFMMASHDGIQQLVGIAGYATCLISTDHMQQRLDICEMLDINSLWADAWEVPLVKKAYGNSLETFKTAWDIDLNWIPNWIAPEFSYWWLPEPISLDPQAIRQKNKFLTMFGSFTELTEREAIAIMEAIPERSRGAKWNNISSAISSTLHINNNINSLPPELFNTQSLALVSARRGQGKFRRDLLLKWNNSCAVTDITIPEALIASHVKPWRESTDQERLDSNNGLLLNASLDSLFDNYLISFNGDGQMLVSSKIDDSQRVALAIPKPLKRKPSFELRKYLEFHETKFNQNSI